MVKYQGKEVKRLSARTLYLTYPQCSAELAQVLESLRRKLEIKEYLIVREGVGSAGEEHTHVHAYLKLIKKVNIRSMETLDLNIEGKIYKGEYRTGGGVDEKDIIEYLTKDKGKPGWDSLVSNRYEKLIGERGEYIEWAEAAMRMAERGQIQEALDLYREESPLQYLNNKTKIEKSLRGIFLSKCGFTSKFDIEDYIVPDNLKKFIEEVNRGKQIEH